MILYIYIYYIGDGVLGEGDNGISIDGNLMCSVEGIYGKIFYFGIFRVFSYIAYSLCHLLLSSTSSGVSLVPHATFTVLHDVWHPYVALARGKLISNRVIVDSTNPAALIAPEYFPCHG